MSFRKIHSVDLRFFCDDASGEYGLAHSNAIYCNTPFNAFWGGAQIFHDVFEHWHEEKSKYFRGQYAFNVGGEMAAMGAMWYYYETLGVYNRPLSNNGYTPFEESMRTTTEDMIEESVEYGYTYFGSALESGVPTQKPVNNGTLEYQINTMFENSKGWTFKGDSDDKERAKEYKKSISFRKIADLHRWGYRAAEKLIPDTQNNLNALVEFIEFFDVWCKNNSAEELRYYYSGMRVDVFKSGKDIKYKCTLISSGEHKDVKLTGTYTVEDHLYFEYND